MPGAETRKCASAESTKKAATAQAVGISNSVVGGSGVLPGGPVMKEAVTGRAKALASTKMSTAWIACRLPMPTLAVRRRR